MNDGDEVLKWDVLNGDVLGAVIRCKACPCRRGTGCDGIGKMHRAYRLPGGAEIDTHRDADILLGVLDRHAQRVARQPENPPPDEPDGR